MARRAICPSTEVVTLIFWEFCLHPWDTAAAKLIVEEAGGAVSRINGKRYSIFAPNILTTNGHLHKAMMSALTGKTR